jgi:hypothetical protein
MTSVLVLLVSVVGVQRGLEQVVQDLQRSHIDANVPVAAEFDRLLQRDLRMYFAERRKEKNVAVDFVLLREGPTQSGIAYPKFYAWVRVAGGKSPADRGAVRLAAIEKTRFEVTDFVSEQTMRIDRDHIYQVFPPQVCDKIKLKLQQ